MDRDAEGDVVLEMMEGFAALEGALVVVGGAFPSGPPANTKDVFLGGDGRVGALE